MKCVCFILCFHIKTNIKILLIRNKKQQKLFVLVPGPVQNLQNAVNETTVGITWDPPEDASCVNEYIISYDGNDIRVSDTTYEINNLLYCTTYQIQVAAVSQDDSIGEYSSTLAELHAPYRTYLI